jgi:hypothetical protein
MPSKAVTNHIVIIVDVNSIPKLYLPSHGGALCSGNENRCPGGGGLSDVEDAAGAGGGPTLGGLGRYEDPLPDPLSSPYNLEVAGWVKEKVVALLCKEAVELSPTTRQFSKFDFSKVLWSFKIYNSSMELNSKTGRAFLPLTIASIEQFEKHLDEYLDPTCQSAIKSSPRANGLHLLSTAIKSVLSDLRWPEPPQYDDDMDGDEGGSSQKCLFHVNQSSSITEFILVSC